MPKDHLYVGHVSGLQCTTFISDGQNDLDLLSEYRSKSKEGKLYMKSGRRSWISNESNGGEKCSKET